MGWIELGKIRSTLKSRDIWAPGMYEKSLGKFPRLLVGAEGKEGLQRQHHNEGNTYRSRGGEDSDPKVKLVVTDRKYYCAAPSGIQDLSEVCLESVKCLLPLK